MNTATASTTTIASIAMAGVLALSACGSSPEANADTPATTEAESASFTECAESFRQDGVDAMLAADAADGYDIFSSIADPGETAEDVAQTLYDGMVIPADDGSSIYLNYGALNSNDEPYSSALGAIPAYQCVLELTDAPPMVLDQIGRTRALDGMQSADWDGYSAQWTYHPDNGMSVTFSEA